MSLCSAARNEESPFEVEGDDVTGQTAVNRVLWEPWPDLRQCVLLRALV